MEQEKKVIRILKHFSSRDSAIYIVSEFSDGTADVMFYSLDGAREHWCLVDYQTARITLRPRSEYMEILI
jgi:hypothetical protein